MADAAPLYEVHWLGGDELSDQPWEPWLLDAIHQFGGTGRPFEWDDVFFSEQPTAFALVATEPHLKTARYVVTMLLVAEEGRPVLVVSAIDRQV